jgi:hypothetical protein
MKVERVDAKLGFYQKEFKPHLKKKEEEKLSLI